MSWLDGATRLVRKSGDRILGKFSTPVIELLLVGDSGVAVSANPLAYPF